MWILIIWVNGETDSILDEVETIFGPFASYSAAHKYAYEHNLPIVGNIHRIQRPN